MPMPGLSMGTEHVVITGGSSGIGLAVARIYAARGARLSLIARGLPALEAARDTVPSRFPVAIQAADVADAEALSAAIAACEAVHGPCTILVANAGIVEPALFDAQSAAAFAQQIDINLSGSVHAVRAVYPAMLARGSGRIMLVSSGAALIGIPGYAAYCASKSALRGFTEALAFEARPRGVSIGICYPPDTQTPQLSRELALRPPAAQVIMGRVRPWAVERVAARLVAAIESGKREEFFSPTLWALARLAPAIRPLLVTWFERRLPR